MRQDVRWNVLADLEVAQLSISCLSLPIGEAWQPLSKPKDIDFKDEDDILERAQLSYEQLEFWGQLSTRLRSYIRSKMELHRQTSPKPRMVFASELQFRPRTELDIRPHSRKRDPDGLTMY